MNCSDICAHGLAAAVEVAGCLYIALGSATERRHYPGLIHYLYILTYNCPAEDVEGRSSSGFVQSRVATKELSRVESNELDHPSVRASFSERW